MELLFFRLHTDSRLRTHPIRRKNHALPWVLAALALAACGDGGGERRHLTVVGTEMAFQAASSVTEGKYAVTFRNAGAVYHELAFRDPSGEFVTRRSIAPGQQVVMDVTLRPGRWELGCYEPGHYEAGMHRTLVVRPR